MNYTLKEVSDDKLYTKRSCC